MALNLKTLGTRSLSAVFFVILLVGAIWYSYYSFFLLFFVIGLLALNEYYRLAEKLNAAPYKLVGSFFGTCLFFWFSTAQLSVALGIDFKILEFVLSGCLILCPFLFMLIALFSDHPTNIWNILHTLLGLLYVMLPLGLLVTIPVSTTNDLLTYNYFKVLGIVFLIWTNDTMAYLGGSLLGRNKLYERISPGKTWEGTIVGALSTAGVGFLLNLDHTYNNVLIWPVIGLLVAALGTTGDLVESMLKRMAGVKDSGQLMPGHGGALDRFDSLIFVTPFVYVFLKGLGAL